MSAPLLAVRGLALTYPARRGDAPVAALGGLDLTIAEGEVVALVGE
ncbi:MAG: ABC transporter ATP-binding protein, partial [Thermoleophilia bacterium]|nr:ABC transporter ATP-binding protein [Thermoleophilia bacterium]